MEQRDTLLIKEQEFKNIVFANDPELYRKMFIDDLTVDDEEVEWEVPETEGDVQRMLSELRQFGLTE